VIRIFDALLRLAEIDAGMRRSGFVSLDVSDLAANAVEFYEPAAELRDIDLCFRSDGPLTISGDPILLAQALSNLIDNALKYAPDHGRIEVAVQRVSERAAEISVSDNGPGIEASERSKVVERFYRGDSSRGTPGVGLGLSVVEAVAKLHGTSLALRDESPGLRAVLSLSIDLGMLPRPAVAGNEAPAGALASPSSTTLATTP
jgi:signal transduction histidine kinase